MYEVKVYVPRAWEVDWRAIAVEFLIDGEFHHQREYDARMDHEKMGCEITHWIVRHEVV